MASTLSAATYSTLSSLFSLSLYGSHRDLPSFPTRRSSDLTRGGGAGRGAQRARPQAGHRVRSEEHTSELQSHSDLVCRLLLEKKKKNEEPCLRTGKEQRHERTTETRASRYASSTGHEA